MTAIQPLRPMSVDEVHLPQTPLATVVAQVQFPRILSIGGAEKVADFQEALRDTYPILTQDQFHQVTAGESGPFRVSHASAWRLADRQEHPHWRVSLGEGFVALDTGSYISRNDFMARLAVVLEAAEQSFRPASATRLGVRYIDRIAGDAAERVDELLAQKIVGVASRNPGQPDGLANSIVHMLTQVQFQASEDSVVLARWGKFPPNTTHDPEMLASVDDPSWVLDMDMSTSRSREFIANELVDKARTFAECLYWLFREMITDDFLAHYGAEL